jgi:hypothetical protein
MVWDSCALLGSDPSEATLHNTKIKPTFPKFAGKFFTVLLGSLPMLMKVCEPAGDLIADNGSSHERFTITA